MKESKIKFADLTGNEEKLNLEALSTVTGGGSVDDGCSTGVCINKRSVGAEFCEGGAVCTSGIGPCSESTGGASAY